MKSVLSLIAVLICTSFLLAEEKVAIVKYDDAKPGIHVFQVTEDGKWEKLPVGAVVDVTSDDPTTPTPTNLSKRTEQVARSINDPEKARNLAIAYSVIILSADDFSTVQQVGQASSAARQSVVGDDEDWEVYNTFVAEEFTKAAQRGELNTVSDYVNLLSQVRTGLLASTEGAAMQKLDLGDIGKIVEITLKIITDIIGGDFPSFEEIIELAKLILDLLSSLGANGTG